MKIAIAADHGGWQLKEYLKEVLEKMGHDVVDLGTASSESVDYPMYGVRVAEKVSKGEVDRGIAICTTGIGMSIVANKVPGVRAALCYDVRTARAGRAHNDSNVLALGGATLSNELAEEILRVWMETPFEGGRHARRVAQIRDIEKNYTGEAGRDGSA